MVQVLAVMVMLVLIVEVVRGRASVKVNANAASVSDIRVSLLLVLIVLYGQMSPRADVVSLLMIPAFGEILADAMRADGARPPLSGTHYGLQRRCGARVEKRSAAFGSPAELASPIRLGYMSARRPDKTVRPAQLRGKRYGRLCQLLSPEGPLSNRHRLPSGPFPRPPGEITPGRRGAGTSVSAPNPRRLT